MSYAALIVTTWLQASAPIVSITPMNSLSICRISMDAAADMVQTQATSNLVGIHGRLHKEYSDDTNEVTLRTQPLGREVVRLRCVAVSPSLPSRSSTATGTPG